MGEQIDEKVLPHCSEKKLSKIDLQKQYGK